MADHLAKLRYKSMKTRWVRIESLTPMYLVISEAEMSTVPVSLMESDISEASLAGRKPVELENADLLFWQQFKRDRESTACKMMICLHRMIL